MRQCGGCTLCCKLLPVRELNKLASVRCKHQSHARGCRVYRAPAQPLSCKLWSCAWLSDPRAADLSRPDRAHYVVDTLPDFVITVDNETGERERHDVVQVWCDQSHPNAWRDPALGEFLGDRMALIRFNGEDGIAVMYRNGVWYEAQSNMREPEHAMEEILGLQAQQG